MKYSTQSNPNFYKKPKNLKDKSEEKNADIPLLTESGLNQNTRYHTSPNFGTKEEEIKEKENNDQANKSINFEDSKVGDIEIIQKNERYDISVKQVKEVKLNYK